MTDGERETLDIDGDRLQQRDAAPGRTVGVLQWDVTLTHGENLRVIVAGTPETPRQTAVSLGVEAVWEQRDTGQIDDNDFFTAVFHLRSFLPTYRVVEPGEQYWDGCGEAHSPTRTLKGAP